MKKENGYWIDDNNNNKWDVFSETEESAALKSATLINCKGCINCNDCNDCINCNDCKSCYDCNDCKSCNNCNDCINCNDCMHCINCNDCRNCNNCNDCRNCYDCINCKSCYDCNDCKSCYDCRNCYEYKENPQRITSKKIGSKNVQTTVYWVDSTNIQVIYGCFKGNLKQFEEKVKKTYKDNQYEKEFLNLIEKVKIYMA